jgi:hypothetical protein
MVKENKKDKKELLGCEDRKYARNNGFRCYTDFSYKINIIPLALGRDK